jgi:hypothetical protein
MASGVAFNPNKPSVLWAVPKSCLGKKVVIRLSSPESNSLLCRLSTSLPVYESHD